MEPARPQDTIPELAKLSNQELEDLLNKDAKFEQFLQTMEKLRNTETIVKELREENERVAGEPTSFFSSLFFGLHVFSMAASILEREPELKRLQEDYEVQVGLLKRNQSELEANTAKLTEVLKVCPPSRTPTKSNHAKFQHDVAPCRNTPLR